jgi:hypothetical protein
MKKHRIHVAIWVLISFSLLIEARSQSTQPVLLVKTMLTGHEIKAQEAVKRATYIVLATFTKLGFPGADASGEIFYEQAEIEVGSALKGSLAGRIKVSYAVYAMPGKDNEATPIVGVQYIMFVEKLGPNEQEIIKLLSATDGEIAAIRALTSAKVVN